MVSANCIQYAHPNNDDTDFAGVLLRYGYTKLLIMLRRAKSTPGLDSSLSQFSLPEAALFFAKNEHLKLSKVRVFLTFALDFLSIIREMVSSTRHLCCGRILSHITSTDGHWEYSASTPATFRLLHATLPDEILPHWNSPCTNSTRPPAS